MEVEVIFKGLIPCVEDGDDSKGSLKTGLAKLQQRFTDRFKQNTQAHFFVGQDQTVQFVR